MTFVIFAVLIVALTLVTRFLRIKQALSQAEAERQSLAQYAEELERRQSDLRKFRHDYRNLLISIRAFLEEDDLTGLKRYFSELEAASGVMASGEALSLEGLGKLKVREVKGLFVAKLMWARTLGIPVAFEAEEEIADIPLDAVALVRMLGILLDNAIEALAELGGGRLRTACFKEGADIVFIVQNTFRPDMLKLQELWQTGFTTKGAHRGLGLTNLLELVGAHSNVTLETEVEGDQFIQTLAIRAEGRG